VVVRDRISLGKSLAAVSVAEEDWELLLTSLQQCWVKSVAGRSNMRDFFRLLPAEGNLRLRLFRGMLRMIAARPQLTLPRRKIELRNSRLVPLVCLAYWSFIGAPPASRLRCAASINAKISSVSALGNGGTPDLKNFTICTTSGR
jgi:hypothetical protein